MHEGWNKKIVKITKACIYKYNFIPMKVVTTKLNNTLGLTNNVCQYS